MLIDLAVLTNRATKIRRIIIVLARDIQQGVFSISPRVYTPDKEGVRVYLNLDHLAELKTRRARKLRDREDHIAGMTEYIDAAISPLPRNLKIWMLESTP